MYPFNHSHRSFGWSLSLCSLLHIVGSFAKFQTGNGNEIVVVGILIDDKQPRDGRESSRIEPSRIDSLVETEGSKELSPEETNCANETGRVISFSFSPFSFFVVAHQVSLNIARPLLEMQFEHARFLLLCPRNEKLALAWDISFVLEMQITTVKRTVRYESLAGREGGEKTVEMWMEKGGRCYRCSVPRNIRVHARFFPWATQKSRRVACTGEGFVAIVRGTTTVWLKRDSSRWIVGREYTRLCAPRIRQDYSHMRRENLANTSVKTLPVPPPSLFLFFHRIDRRRQRRFRNWRRPELGCGLHS